MRGKARMSGRARLRLEREGGGVGRGCEGGGEEG